MNLRYGLDISNNQGTVPDVNFQSKDFIIAKVTQDSSFVDEWFPVYREQARRFGCGFGGYHFMDMDEQPDPEESCDFFIEHLGEQEVGEVAALDTEVVEVSPGVFHNTNPDQLEHVVRWGQRFRSRADYKPKIYLSYSYIIEHNLNHKEVSDEFELWYAWWPNDAENLTPPTAPSPWTSFKLWQYRTDRTYDEDAWNGTMVEFREQGKPKASEPHPYEDAYWTPMQNLLNKLVQSHTHADAAFHATVSNAITMHKIALGVEPAD